MNTNHHPDDQLAERVLERITHEKLSPRPRWEFIATNYAFWIFGAFAVLLGAFAFSATLFEITNVDWRLGSATHSDLFSFFFAAAPLFWVITLIVFTVVGYITVRFTTHGYRYPLVVIALGAILLSLSFGTGIYAAGFGKEVEEVLGDHPPFYRPIIVAQQSWWLAPEKGLLGGEVVQATSNVDSFTLIDSSNHTWKVDGSDLRTRDRITVARGGNVRIVGSPTTASTSAFHACFVFPGEMSQSMRNRTPLRPLAVVASTSERKEALHTEICKGIRPYEQLRSIDEEDF